MHRHEQNSLAVSHGSNNVVDIETTWSRDPESGPGSQDPEIQILRPNRTLKYIII